VSSSRRGFIYGLLAYLIWGLFPLYWPLLEPANAEEILAHRIVWSAVAVTILLIVTRQFRAVRALPPATIRRLCLAGAVVAVSWGVYIYGVNSHHVVETSLGYFINPLVTVVLGVAILDERLRRVQWCAVALGVVAVVVITIDYGRPPWISLILAGSFGTYGLIKKQVAAAPAPGLFVESMTLAVPALTVIVALQLSGHGTWSGHGSGHVALLATSGVVTAVPLLLFAGAAHRLPLVTLGLLQYLTPTLQLLVGVVVRHEPMPPSRLAGFLLVWAALAVLTVDGLRLARTRPNRPRPDPDPAMSAMPLADQDAAATLPPPAR
jgi:chloramphenicol-sensitive protein RarD